MLFAPCTGDRMDSAGPQELTSIIARLRAAQARLAQRSTGDVLGSLEAVVTEWLEPDSPWRQEAEARLPEATGFSAPMIRYALPFTIEPLRAPAIAELLARELGGREPRGPVVIAHVLAGNLPGLAAVPIALSLAIRSAALVKPGRGDRVFPEVFARSIAAADPELGACVAVRYWPGGDRACEAAVCDGAELVVASGGDTSIADLRARCRARFIGHGHRVSFAIVTREHAVDAAAADALALDASLWDQRGCLSPQLCFVEGDFAAAERFAAQVAAALARWAARLPPGATSLDEQAAVRRFRDEAEWSGIARGTAVLHAPRDSLAWAVAIEREPVFRPTPLCRTVRVMPVANPDDLPAVLAPARAVLEAAGVAAPPERRPALEALLGRSGVHRVCALGRMQRPPLAWPQGGRPRVADWVT
jgi:hypothetical protein